MTADFKEENPKHGLTDTRNIVLSSDSVDHETSEVGTKTNSLEPFPTSNGEGSDEKKQLKTDVPAKTSENSEKMTWEDWKKLPMQFFKVYVVIFCMWLGLLSIYWGALYRREDRVKNMKILVAIEDSSVALSNSTIADPIVGPMFEDLLNSHKALGHYVFANVTDLAQAASEKNHTIIEVLESKVHEQKYWAALHVNKHTSAYVYDLLLSGNTLSPAAASVGLTITCIYETGMHYSALAQYVTKNIRTLQLDWTSIYAPLAYGAIIKSYLSTPEQQALATSANSSSTGASFSYLPLFKLMDLRPARSTAVLGPSGLGLVYAQIFSFHQFNFSVDLHNSVRESLRFRHFLCYRILFSQVNHIVLALVYGLMTIAFRVPTDVAFGKSGFLVLWATMYLFISASGGLNECVVTLITFYNKIYLLPPWIIIMIVLNISPTFAPLVLSPGFYRYGYSMPMFHAYEALKVVFFDTWKGTLGLNYGILAAWVVVTNIALCFILGYISRKTRGANAAAEKGGISM